MDDLICKYFSGELTGEENQDILIHISQNSDLREEFIETQNLMGIIKLLPCREDESKANIELLKFIEHTQRTKKSKYNPK